jgi:hypothetical protein
VVAFISYCIVALLVVGEIDLTDTIKDAIGPYGIRLGKSVHYIKDGQRANFPDIYTMNRMGYDYELMPQANKNPLLNIPQNDSIIKSLIDHHSNERMLQLVNLSSNFVLKNEKVFPYLNPSFIYFHDYILVSYRHAKYDFRLVVLRRPYGSYLITNGSVLSQLPMQAMTDYEIEKDIEYMKGINLNDPKLPSVEMFGEDPRIFIMENIDKQKYSIWASFCRRYKKVKPEVQMTHTQILFDPSATGEKQRPLNYETAFEIVFESTEDQKNWTPLVGNLPTNFFHYLGNVIHPHRVVELSRGWKYHKRIAKSIAETWPVNSTINDYWPYGTIRGGTPALLDKENNVFLSFFHSSTVPERTGENILKTYVVGAFLFCNRHPEYKLLKMSRFPIAHPAMYTGKWPDLPFAVHHMDYIIFPMSFIVSKDHRKIYLTYGRQDTEGWILTLDYQGLMASMRTVNENC